MEIGGWTGAVGTDGVFEFWNRVIFGLAFGANRGNLWFRYGCCRSFFRDDRDGEVDTDCCNFFKINGEEGFFWRFDVDSRLRISMFSFSEFKSGETSQLWGTTESLLQF